MIIDLCLLPLHRSVAIYHPLNCIQKNSVQPWVNQASRSFPLILRIRAAVGNFPCLLLPQSQTSPHDSLAWNEHCLNKREIKSGGPCDNDSQFKLKIASSFRDSKPKCIQILLASSTSLVNNCILPALPFFYSAISRADVPGGKAAAELRALGFC